MTKIDLLRVAVLALDALTAIVLVNVLLMIGGLT